MSTADILVLALILVAVGLVALRLVSNRRKGKHGCAGCAGCSQQNNCPSAHNPPS